MPAPALVQSFSRLVLKVASALSFLPPLLTRLVLGVVFFGTGKGKWGDLDKVTGFFTNLGIPAPRANAVLVATVELAGGICLVLGLLTRPAAFFLSCTMVVALMTAHREEFKTDLKNMLTFADGKDLTDITAFVFLLFLLWLMAYGPGAISLDRLFKKWWVGEPND